MLDISIKIIKINIFDFRKIWILTCPIIRLFIEDFVFFRTDALLVFSMIARSSRAARRSLMFNEGSTFNSRRLL